MPLSHTPPTSRQLVFLIAVLAIVVGSALDSSAAADAEAPSDIVCTDTRNVGECADNGTVQTLFTPLAGEAYKTTLFGREIEIPARNRENVRSLTLGGNCYAPELNGNLAVPIAAFYYRHRWDDWWTRDILGLFVNEMDVARSFDRFQLLGHFENNTIPFADSEVQKGRQVKASSVIWGYRLRMAWRGAPATGCAVSGG